MSKQSFTTGQVLTAAQVNSLQANDFNQTVSVKTANYTLAAADKGTRIEFNTSGSVTCTVNSGLFDAGDTLVIQNRGAGTATITAGTATVNTSASLALAQYSAGTLYFVSDSAAIFFGDAAGISASIVDAKGDLIVGTADNTVGRLAVGTNGYTLVADSSVSPQGLKWAVDPVADVITTAGDLIYGTAADTVARLGIGTAGQVLKVNSGATAPEWGTAGGGATFTTGNDTVTTGQTTSSSSFTDLTTVGPTVTLTTGTKALIMLSVQLDNQAANRQGTASIEVSGASSVSPSDGPAFHIFSSSNTAVQATTTYIVTGLTAGSNTFKVKYKAAGSTTVNFGERRLSVIDLGS